MATAKERREAREREALAQERSQETNREFMTNPGAVRDVHGEVAKPSSAGAKVTIACKLGVAWIDLQITRMVEKREQSQAGERTVTEGVRTGNVVRIRGTAYPRGTLPEGFPPPPMIVAGAAMNPGIDRDFWETWKEQNHLNPLVMNGMIFAHENDAMVIGRAKEEISNRSGLEPINPKDDPRTPKSTRGDLSDVETEEGRASKRVA